MTSVRLVPKTGGNVAGLPRGIVVQVLHSWSLLSSNDVARLPKGIVLLDNRKQSLSSSNLSSSPQIWFRLRARQRGFSGWWSYRSQGTAEPSWRFVLTAIIINIFKSLSPDNIIISGEASDCIHKQLGHHYKLFHVDSNLHHSGSHIVIIIILHIIRLSSTYYHEDVSTLPLGSWFTSP